MRPALLVIFAGLFFATNAAGQERPAFLDDDVSYFWPTNASRYMSSSFGETRSAHFHAAMDIGTWGHEGYPIFATRDGVLYRVGVSPSGYGNVIYLKHDDGSYSLYAHLKDFHPEIRELVDSLRLPEYTFDFDKVLKDYGITFRRGEQIGWSGSTGVGPPHLHFELRSPEGRPFNPLLAGIEIDDTIPPRFSGLAIEPLGLNSSISGTNGGIRRVRPAFRDGWFDFGHHNVTGEIGLAVNVFDRADGSNNVHAVYELEMYVNDERYFHSRVDSFSFDQTRQMFVDRVFSILRTERKGYQRLYVRNGNNLPFYKDTGHSGKLDLPPGRHDITIYTSDFFGNRSRARLVLEVEDPSDTPGDAGTVVRTDFPDGYIQSTSKSAGGATRFSHVSDSAAVFAADSNRPGKIVNAGSHVAGFTNHQPPRIPENLFWNKNWVRLKNTVSGGTSGESDNDFAEDAQVLSLRPLGSFSDEQTVIRGNSGVPLDKSSRMLLSSGEQSWKLNRIYPEQRTTIYSGNMRVSVDFPEGSFFEPVTIGLASDYPAFALFPDSKPFRRPAAVRIHLDQTLRNIPGLGLYRINSGNRNSSHVASIKDPDQSVLVASINSGGKYTLKADTAAPSVTSPSIGKWSHIDEFFATVSVNDEKSGINYRSAVFKVNGERGIAEYDPEKKLLRFHLPGFRPEQVNELRVRISDNAGNTTEKTFSDVRYN